MVASLFIPTLTEMIQGIFAKSFLFRVNATTNDNTPGKNRRGKTL